MGGEQELTGKGGGVGGDRGLETPPTKPGSPPAGGSPPTGEPTAAPGAPIAGEKKPELTDSEEFRRWQAASDRRTSQLQTQLVESQRQAQEAQRQLEEARLKDADPDQVAAYYRDRAAQADEAMAGLQATRMEQERIIGHVRGELEKVGLTPESEGLVWPEEITWEGAAEVLASAARLKELQVQELARTGDAGAQQAADAARLKALQDAGVTQVSTATGASAGGANPIADITDVDTLLGMGLAGKKGGRG